MRRVAITGIGLVSPIGSSFEDYWSHVRAGTAAFSPLRHAPELDPGRTILAGVVPAAALSDDDTALLGRGQDRAVVFAKRAVRSAIENAGFEANAGKSHRIGVWVGTANGSTGSIENTYTAFAREGLRGVRPKAVSTVMMNSIAAELAITYHLTGESFTLATACASSNMALGQAADAIAQGREDLVIAGGVDTPLFPACVAGWLALRVLSPSAEPTRCCLPFHRDRAGLCLAEGAAFYVLEELTHARSRGARVYGEILGHATNCDATHMTHPNGARQAEAMRTAVLRAGVDPRGIDYINAHGTGTLANDITEANAIRTAFPEAAEQIRVSSTKSVLGHALGASGALELATVLGAFEHGEVPPTANLDEVDPEIRIRVSRTPERIPVRVALSNSFAFGGVNSVLVLQHRDGR